MWDLSLRRICSILRNGEGRSPIVVLSEAKDLCICAELHRSFAAKNAAQDDRATDRVSA
jgi:hypothetical protein